MKAPVGFEQKRAALINDKCKYAEINLDKFYPELKNHYLFCATETISKKDIDQLAKEVA
jgi:glycine dehydrogenase subunit 1